MNGLRKIKQRFGRIPKILALEKSLVLPWWLLTNHRCQSSVSQPSPSSASSLSNQKHCVAIVGSGPAGFYTAQHLLKSDHNLIVDVYEKLPVPFGLVRFGVAPDHPDVKNVIHTFTNTAHIERFNFFGNVEIGKDLSLKDLRDAYSAVVLCYGASDSKTLDIPGENLPNVLSARSFVGWYNGLPQDKELPVSLDCESAVVLGHGNVAIDVARILLTPISVLEKTDISEHALEILRKSRVTKVHIVGRRGPLQVAFTIKELREMIKLSGTRTVIHSADVEGLDKIIDKLPRPRRRLTELMYKTAVTPSSADTTMWTQASKEWRLVFLRSPVRICHNSSGSVTGVEFAVNQLQGEKSENQKYDTTDLRETIDCGLVLSSIGYRSLAMDSSLPFDSIKGVIVNENSKVQGQKGLYCAGWVGKGPVGVILGTMTDAFETGRLVLHDIETGDLIVKDKAERDRLVGHIKDKAVTFTDWEKIDLAETTAGEKIGKPREKMTDIQAMLNLVKKS
uniref:NADPH:adrenodoxin oxidoreductase, mitochondrial n=1 Tax=Arion vulgaris TaxID=1028688 RepID=A0A0B7AF05_9EUPU